MYSTLAEDNASALLQSPPPPPRSSQWSSRGRLVAAGVVGLCVVACVAVAAVVTLESSTSVVVATDSNTPSSVVNAVGNASEVKVDPKVVLDTMILIGKALVPVVKEGKPVIDTKEDAINIFPKGLESWDQMESWKPTSWPQFEYKVRTLGIEVAKFTWSFTWFGKGSYEEHGMYIGRATVSPGQIQLAWGHNMNAVVTVGAPYNTGSKDQPVAAVTLSIDIETSNAFWTEKYRCTVVIQGDLSGDIMECPQSE
eukprot:GFYU01006015.1.p1 GENE.GFYU01006015.1~~GFYU01006015.1.p1  ORF type:complete len:254 (-),score=68.66 GFYU01006015.1:69-830(-)